MTTPSPSDDRASMPLLDDRTTGRTVIEAFWATQNDQAPRGRMARVFGRSPLSNASRPWFVDALGEIEVAERLRALGTRGEAWRVLHSVPIGAGTSDIDHVVIGPAGVFTLLMHGRMPPERGRARDEAERASILLESALGSPVPVKPLVVVVGAAGARVRGRAADVETVTAARVDRYLRHQRPVYSVEEVRELTRAALKPRTWYPRAPKALKTPEERAGSSALPTQHELRTWFARVRSEVDAARRVQSFWAAGAAAVLVAAVLGAPALVQGLIG